jgi:putative transposase
MVAAVELAPLVGVQPLLEALGLSRATFYRRLQGPTPERRPSPPSDRALTEDERTQVLDVLHSPEFIDAAPAEVYSSLLSEGTYLCSVRTMYRVLESAKEVRERRNRAQHPVYHRPELVATGPNQVWSWDISKLRTGVPFVYLFLYVILDIFSRYVVGWMIAERENSALAKRLIEGAYVQQGVQPDQLILHADNGPQMVAHPTVQLCAKLGIMRSHNRPYVSNDNPYSESQFATAKQHPGFPKRFGCLVDALAWGREFFPWYNEQHHHSGLAYLTPSQVHNKACAEVLDRRQAALDTAYAQNPKRFVRGEPRVKHPPLAAWINPPAEEKVEDILRKLGLRPAREEVLAQ